MECPCCQSKSKFIFFKYDVVSASYYECESCKTLFVHEGLDQMNKVCGESEDERNRLHNDDRIGRFIYYVGINSFILDYGCGSGLLVKDAKNRWLNIDGYDLHNLEYCKLKDTHYDLVSMIEVVEHLSKPFKEFDEVYNLLEDGGILYIETSFTDTLEKPLSFNHYVNPTLGHATIFSNLGLDTLLKSKGFNRLEPINQNVRIYQKQK